MGEEAGKGKFDPQRSGKFEPVRDDEEGKYKGCIVLAAYFIGAIAFVGLLAGAIFFVIRVLR